MARAGIELTSESKYQNGLKSSLKRVLRLHVPPEIVDRPKQGFAVPLAQWLHGYLSNEVEDVLGSRKFRESGWLNMSTVQRVWRGFRSGRTEYAHNVWMLFCLAQHLVQPQEDALFTSLRQSSSTRAA